jgi:hypothetical protein
MHHNILKLNIENGRYISKLNRVDIANPKVSTGRFFTFVDWCITSCEVCTNFANESVSLMADNIWN